MVNVGKERKVKNLWEKKKLSQIRSTNGTVTPKRSTWQKSSKKAVMAKNVSHIKKCNQQWKQVKNSGKNQWWKMKTTTKPVMKSHTGFSFKNRGFYLGARKHFLNYKKFFWSGQVPSWYIPPSPSILWNGESRRLGILQHSVKLHWRHSPQSIDTGQNSDEGIPDFRISG